MTTHLKDAEAALSIASYEHTHFSTDNTLAALRKAALDYAAAKLADATRSGTNAASLLTWIAEDL